MNAEALRCCVDLHNIMASNPSILAAIVDCVMGGPQCNVTKEHVHTMMSTMFRVVRDITVGK